MYKLMLNMIPLLNQKSLAKKLQVLYLFEEFVRFLLLIHVITFLVIGVQKRLDH